MEQINAFLDLSKPFERIKLPRPTSRKYVRSEASESIDTKSLLSSYLKPESGIEYAQKYIIEEEQQLLEQAKKGIFGTNKLDEISIGTVRTVSEIQDHDLEKMYRTYDFTYREKQTLPVNKKREQIVAMIETNSVIVIEGPTGCGKTTQVPQFILDSCYQKRQHCNIIVTQPRRIAAISIAKRVCSERQWPMGSLVGYQVGMLNKVSHDTRITFVTTGVLLQKLINAKNMLDYTHVILDEVHERDQDLDFLMLIVRKLLRTNSRSVKVILMSATITVDKFAQYFSSPIGGIMKSAPILDIAKCHTYTIDKYYLCQLESLGPLPPVSLEDPRISSEMMHFSAKLIKIFDDVDKFSQRDQETISRHVVLVFLPGIWEIEEMHAILSDFADEEVKWDILILHSTITNDEQQLIFDNPPDGYRRIILSTNIAESSITVPNVKYVIDFCLTKSLVTNVETNFHCLELKWASKTNCEQRAGRTGRVMQGRVYRLVPKYFYEKYFDNEPIPEIMRAPLEHVVLNAKLLNMGPPKNLLALSLDPPDLYNLERTILLLKEAGALHNSQANMDPFDGDLTGLGRMMSRLPVEIQIAKFIALGHAFGILRSAIIIGASMSTKSMFSAPFKQKLQSYSAKVQWADGSCSDLLANLNAYQVWLVEKETRITNKRMEKDWAKRNFLQLRVLYEIMALSNELTQRLEVIGITLETGKNDYENYSNLENSFILKLVIAGAFYPNYFENCASNKDKEEEGLKKIAGLDPLRTVFLHRWPRNQPGPLYVKNIQEVFKDCCGIKQMSKIRVQFDSSTRIYITFPLDSRKLHHATDAWDLKVPGKISDSVYRALRMREGNGVEISVLHPADAEAKFKKYNLDAVPITQVYRDTRKKLGANNVQFKIDEEGITRYYYVRPILPKLSDINIKVKILKIINPGYFWATKLNDESGKLYSMIESQTKDKDMFVPLDKRPFIGELVIAPEILNKKDVKYHRAVVQSIVLEENEEKVGVLFVDKGDLVERKLTDLLRFKEPNDIMKIPALAFECVLVNIKPSESRRCDGHWTNDSIKFFKQLLYQKDCYGEVYSVVNGIVSMKLTCHKDCEEYYDVNEILVEEGFADIKKEDFLSQMNHDIRLNIVELNKEQIEFYEYTQYDENDCPYKYPEIDSKECDNKIKVLGPYSPLEMELASLILSSCGKTAKVSSWSVNSILLNTNPGNYNKRLVVAGRVHQNVQGTRLNIDDTILMPNTDGLTCLLALIFAPKVELRRNKFGSGYSSVLCGLGSHVLSRHSLFEEHDMEIPFDIEINNEDLLEINKLRHWMSIALMFSDDKQDNKVEDTIRCQERCRDAMKNIFYKKRVTKKVDLDVPKGQWMAYDETLLLQPVRVKMIKDNIFPLHFALRLEIPDPELEKMVEHLQELKIIASENPSKYYQEFTCKLCDKVVFGVNEVKVHLAHPVHRRNVSKLNLPDRITI